ncbi:NUDIX domain-containing protein [Candidatus Saccharibacteria bacterium]|nr:NUDIX domain-containing protein [Candidatus Saccharibacteria bacterium]
MKNQEKKKQSRRQKVAREALTQQNQKSQKKKPEKVNSTPAKKPDYTYRTATGTLKIPEALPTKEYKEPKFPHIFHKKPAIQEIVREPTSGGIVYRMTKDQKDIEILLIQDSKNRWTIPKGHIEPGETAKQTAIREIGEESGLHHVKVLTWLGKIHFKYRRQDRLVLMTTQIYLVRALDKTEKPQKEKWMNGIRWFSFPDALDAIEYDDIEKLMLIARKKIRNGEI